MRHFKNIIIGFGKAGKTLAGSLTSHGEEVLLIEKRSNDVRRNVSTSHVCQLRTW